MKTYVHGRDAEQNHTLKTGNKRQHFGKNRSKSKLHSLRNSNPNSYRVQPEILLHDVTSNDTTIS
jgi:hypothetical protein